MAIIWPLVQAALATLIEFEVLDGVGDEQRLAIEPGLRQRLVEHPSGRADKPLTRQILAVAGLFAHQHDTRPRRTLTRHDLGRMAVERAARAIGLGGAQGFQALEFRHKRQNAGRARAFQRF